MNFYLLKGGTPVTTEEREAMVLILAARKRVYKVLQDLWLNEPAENSWRLCTIRIWR